MGEHLGKLIGELPFLKNAVIDIAYEQGVVKRKRPVEEIWVKLVAELVEEGWAKKDLREVDAFLGTLDDGPESDEFTRYVLHYSLRLDKCGSEALMQKIEVLFDTVSEML